MIGTTGSDTKVKCVVIIKDDLRQYHSFLSLFLSAGNGEGCYRFSECRGGGEGGGGVAVAIAVPCLKEINSNSVDILLAITDYNRYR